MKNEGEKVSWVSITATGTVWRSSQSVMFLAIPNESVRAAWISPKNRDKDMAFLIKNAHQRQEWLALQNRLDEYNVSDLKAEILEKGVRYNGVSWAVRV